MGRIEGFQRDGNRAGGEIGARLPVRAGGKKHGASDIDVDGVARIARFADGDGGSRGNPAERVGDGVGHMGDVVEGEDTFAGGELQDRPVL